MLELHQSLIPLLDAETRVSLEADLSQWFQWLIHNRLRTGKIETDLAVLAGRIADAFSHTVEGASLRASLPTSPQRGALLPLRPALKRPCQRVPACLAQAQPRQGRQGHPAREPPPEGQIKIVRAALGDDAGSWARLDWRANTSCTRKVA